MNVCRNTSQRLSVQILRSWKKPGPVVNLVARTPDKQIVWGSRPGLESTHSLETNLILRSLRKILHDRRDRPLLLVEDVVIPASVQYALRAMQPVEGQRSCARVKANQCKQKPDRQQSPNSSAEPETLVLQSRRDCVKPLRSEKTQA